MDGDGADIFTDEDIELDSKNEAKFIKKKRKELLKAEERRRKNELRQIRKSNRFVFNADSERRKKATTTKILIYFILLNCTIIEVYSMIVMVMLKDLSALVSLIGAVVGESITYAIYCAKSHLDTREEKRLEFDKEVFEAENEEGDEGLEEVDEEPDEDEEGDE